MTINIEIMNVTEIQIVDTGYLTTEINIVMIGKDIIVIETEMNIQKYLGQREITGAITKMIKILIVAQGKEVSGQMSQKEENANATGNKRHLDHIAVIEKVTSKHLTSRRVKLPQERLGMNLKMKVEVVEPLVNLVLGTN